MIEFYPQLRSLHILTVILSGSLFMLRGVMMLSRSRFTNHAGLRVASVAIDTVLLASALMLVAVLHAYPFVQHWLTVKVLLLVVYIVLGTIALKRGRTRTVQVVSYFAALFVYAFIVSVARAHEPWGFLGRFIH